MAYQHRSVPGVRFAHPRPPDEADLMEAMGTPEFAELGQALLDDESTFIDHARSSAFIVREVGF